MKSKATEANLSHVFELYAKHRPETALELSDEIKTELTDAFSDSDVTIVHNAQWENFVVLFPYNKVLTMNPWFFNGYPIGEGNHDTLIDEAITVFNQSTYNTLELISTRECQTVLPHLYDYADMRLILKESPLVEHTPEVQTLPIIDVDIQTLKLAFHNAFLHGDAKFYGLLDEEDQQKFWQYLGYDDAKDNTCSLAFMVENQLIGFSLVLDYGEKNKHISCMCITPPYQGKGYANTMMNTLISTAIKTDYVSMTLGTETHMRAHHLYKKYGFIDTKIKHHYILQKK